MGGYNKYFSISFSYIPAGIAFGAFAIALRIPAPYAIMLSLLVFSGAVQSAFLGFWVAGIEPFSIILTAFLLNLRHTFYGAHIESQRKNVTISDIFKIGPFLTDEAYALAVSDSGMSNNAIFALSIYGYINWASATVLGVFLASIVPLHYLDILLMALPALFMGLLVPKLKGNYAIITVASAGAISIIGRILDFPSFFIIVPIMLGVIAGATFKKLSEGGK